MTLELRMQKMKKEIRVVAALIEKENKVFAAKRAYGFLKGKWELPGGKIEAKETPEEALIREIKEELSTDIKVEKFVTNVVYEYPDFLLNMDVFKCVPISGRLSLDKSIHTEEAFLDIKSEFISEDWCPADSEVILSFRSEK